nr:5285_t:CDS:2 [Entrophospora candida]
MYSYNPLLLPDTIATIVQKLTLDSISIALWINRAWNKEVKHELHTRREKLKKQYWRTVSVRYMEKQIKKQYWEEDGRRYIDYMGTGDHKKFNKRIKFLDGECHKFYYELVKMHPWSEYGIEEMINPKDYET